MELLETHPATGAQFIAHESSRVCAVPPPQWSRNIAEPGNFVQAKLGSSYLFSDSRSAVSRGLMVTDDICAESSGYRLSRTRRYDPYASFAARGSVALAVASSVATSASPATLPQAQKLTSRQVQDWDTPVVHAAVPHAVARVDNVVEAIVAALLRLEAVAADASNGIAVGATAADAVAVRCRRGAEGEGEGEESGRDTHADSEKSND